MSDQDKQSVSDNPVCPFSKKKLTDAEFQILHEKEMENRKWIAAMKARVSK